MRSKKIDFTGNLGKYYFYKTATLSMFCYMHVTYVLYTYTVRVKYIILIY